MKLSPPLKFDAGVMHPIHHHSQTLKTVIISGTSAQGAVAGSTQGATERGFKAIVPVDGMASEEAFNELYAAWHLAKGGPVALVENVTVTRGDLIKYGN